MVPDQPVPWGVLQEGEGALPADWKAAMVPGLFAELEQLTDRMMR